MTRIVGFSDLHCHKWREFARLDTKGDHDRLMDCLSVFDQVATLAREEGAAAVLFFGDLFHTRNVLNTDVYQMVTAALTAAAKKASVTFYMIPGNHDQATRTGERHSLYALQNIPGVVVVDEPRVIRLTHKHSFLMVPYQDDPNALRRALANSTYDFAGIHAGIQGATVGSFEARPKEDFKLTDFGNLPKNRVTVISGHYHKPQELAGGRVVYCGAALQHQRSDAGEARGFMVLDLDTGKYARVPNPLAPRFVTLTDDDIANKDPAQWDVENNFVDILLRHEPDGGIERFREMARQLPTRGEPNVVFVPPPKAAEKRLNVDPAMSLVKMLEQYVEEFKPEELDTSTLHRLAEEFIP